MSNDLLVIQNTIDAVSGEFEKICQASLLFKKEASFALQAIQSNSYLASTAIQNPQSLKNAIINVAAIGLSLSPALKMAYLVPRDKKVCLDISYMGLARLATDSGSVLWVQADVVRKTDLFTFNGPGTKPTHGFDPFGGDRGPIVGVYCVVKTHSNDYIATVMSTAECHAIRDRTEAYKAYKDGKIKTCPWVSDEGEMMKKTVIKRAYKLWPKSERLMVADEVLNEHEGISFEKEQEAIVLASSGQLKELQTLLGGEVARTEKMISHLIIKDKRPLSGLQDLSSSQAQYAIEILKKQEQSRKEAVQSENNQSNN